MKQKATPLEQTSNSLFDAIVAQDAQDGFDQAQDAEVNVKRTSAWGIVAIILALISTLSILSFSFLFFAAFAIVAALISLYLIKRSGGELTGAIFAYPALAIAIAVFVATPLNYCVYRQAFERQADEFFHFWSDTVRSGDATGANMCSQYYWDRSTIVDRHDEIDYWVRAKGGDEEPHSNVHSYLSNPTLLTLATLDDKATARLHRIVTTFLSPTNEQTDCVYAITCEPTESTGDKQTFFIRVVLERKTGKTEEGEKKVGWRIQPGDFAPLQLDAQGEPVITN